MIRAAHAALAAIGLTVEVIVIAWHSGYDPQVVERPLPTASIAGQVTDLHGQAIAGARICGFGSGLAISGDDAETARCAIAGIDGRYRLIALLPGRYAISASADHRVPERAACGGIAIAQGEAATRVNIALAPGGAPVSGTVRDVAGRAIGGAQVTIEAASGSGFVVARTAHDGTFATWSVQGRQVTVAAGQRWTGMLLALSPRRR